MTPPPSAPSASKAAHARPSSTNAPYKTEARSSKRITEQEEKVQFTVLVRLPFPRGDFVDPPQVEWDTTKDQALWKIISRSSKTSSLDWTELANKFQVPHAFILQQAAWLYERHLSHVRAQMKKVQAPTAPGTGSASSNTPLSSVPMKRLGSGGSRAPSALSLRTKAESPKPDFSIPGTPKATAPPLSRTPSATTVTQSGLNTTPSAIPASPRQPHRSFRSSFPPARKPSPAVPAPKASTSPGSTSDAEPDPSSSDSSSSEEEPNNPIRRSQIFKRPPRFTAHKSPLAPLDSTSENDPEEETSSSTSSLPFATFASPQNPRSSRHPPQQQPPSSPHRQKLGSISALTSSTTSSTSPPSNPHRARLNPHKRPSQTSSPSTRSKGKETASDGTPSMGSSFSDLDDASVTQSALEEALLSNIQHGRMSTLSSLRSRYL